MTSPAFKSCREVVGDYESYIRDCEMDACACDSGGDCGCLCTALTNFAAACNEIGAQPGRWRSQHLCRKFALTYYTVFGITKDLQGKGVQLQHFKVHHTCQKYCQRYATEKMTFQQPNDKMSCSMSFVNLITWIGTPVYRCLLYTHLYIVQRTYVFFFKLIF